VLKYIGEPHEKGLKFACEYLHRRDWFEEEFSMYAIIKTGGKQYKAEPGRFIDVEKLCAAVGDEVSFPALMVVDGDAVKVGNPVLEEVKVSGKVIAQGKEKKVIVYKYLPKKDHHKKQGHRQPYTRVEITAIG